MFPAWSALLADEGARFNDESRAEVAYFSDAAAELEAAAAGDAVFDLSALGAIGIGGDEAADFLQGQLTHDTRLLTPARSLLAAYCSPRGRALALLRLVAHGGGTAALLPAASLAATLQRLRMFVLRAKATLDDASNEWVRIGVVGERAANALASRFGTLPEAPDAALERHGVSLVRLRGAQPRFLALGHFNAVAPLWAELRAVARPAGSEAWRLTEILAGQPAVYPETADAFVPQMLNLQALDAISFRKGCYTGQEIVARTQYLGTLKRRLVLTRAALETPPAPGTPLAAGEAAIDAGRVVDAARHPAGGCALLAVAALEHAERLRLGTVPLRLEPLPYPLEAGSS